MCFNYKFDESNVKVLINFLLWIMFPTTQNIEIKLNFVKIEIRADTDTKIQNSQ